MCPHDAAVDFGDSGQQQEAGGQESNQHLGEYEMDGLSFGHQMQAEPSNSFCIALLNIGGIPIHDNDPKMVEIKQFVLGLHAHVLGFTECNVHWKLLPVHSRLAERTRGWFETLHLNTAYYDKIPRPSKFQVGGVSLWSMGEGAHRVMESGCDPRGLGHWAWT